MKYLNKSSMLYWYPKIKDLAIPQPRTMFVKITEHELSGDGLCQTLVNRVRKAIDANFKLPVFIRTDHASGKHEWERSCYYTGKFNNPKRIGGKTPLHQNLWEIISFNQCATVLGLDYKVIVLREFIKMDATFKAFHGRMPVNSERRYFINEGKLVCRHPYWIPKAIESDLKYFWGKYLPKNWRTLLKKHNTQTQNEIKLLTEYANQVAEVFEGYWSVDFCRGKNGIWYLIDMGEGHKSWHPKCEKKGGMNRGE